jgi:hypothetical protein
MVRNLVKMRLQPGRHLLAFIDMDIPACQEFLKTGEAADTCTNVQVP